MGYIYPHDKDVVSPIVKGPAIGGQIAFEWHTDGSRQWHLDFNRPTVGVALQVLDLSNPQKLGQMIAPYAYINVIANEERSTKLLLNGSPYIIVLPGKVG